MKSTLDEELGLESDAAWHIAFDECFDANPAVARNQCISFRERQRYNYINWKTEASQQRFVDVINYFRKNKEFPSLTIPDFIDDTRSIDEILTPTGKQDIEIDGEEIEFIQYDKLLVAASLNKDFVDSYKDLESRDATIRKRLIALCQGEVNGNRNIEIVPSSVVNSTSRKSGTIRINLIPGKMQVYIDARMPFSIILDHEVEHTLAILYAPTLLIAREGTPDSQYRHHEERHARERDKISLTAMGLPMRSPGFGYLIPAKDVTSTQATLRVANEGSEFELLTEFNTTGYVYEIHEKKNELIMLTKEGKKKFYLDEFATFIALTDDFQHGKRANASPLSSGEKERLIDLIRDAQAHGDALTIKLESNETSLPLVANRLQVSRQGISSDIPSLNEDELREMYDDVLLKGFSQLHVDRQAMTTSVDFFKYVTFDSFKKNIQEAQQYGNDYLAQFKEEYLIGQQFRLYEDVRIRDANWDWAWDNELDKILDDEQYNELREEREYETQLASAVTIVTNRRPAFEVADINNELADSLLFLARLLERPQPEQAHISRKIDGVIGNERESRDRVLDVFLQSANESEKQNAEDPVYQEVATALNQIQGVLVSGNLLSSELLKKLRQPLEVIDRHEEGQYGVRQDALYFWFMGETYRWKKILLAAMSKEIAIEDELSVSETDEKQAHWKTIGDEAKVKIEKAISNEQSFTEHIESLECFIRVKEEIQSLMVNRMIDSIQTAYGNYVKVEAFKNFLNTKTFKEL